jgi:hypothetical protein
VEASTFGSDFTGMKNASKRIEALLHRLQMFKVPIEGPMNIFCDNQAVCKRVVPDPSGIFVTFWRHFYAELCK